MTPDAWPVSPSQSSVGALCSGHPSPAKGQMVEPPTLACEPIAGICCLAAPSQHPVQGHGSGLGIPTGCRARPCFLPWGTQMLR